MPSLFYSLVIQKIARRKVNRERKRSFEERKAGLFKKAHELTTLCGVEACAVIYSGNPEPEVWPSRSVAERVIRRFKTKYMMYHDELAKQQLSKAELELKKVQNINRLKELAIMVYNIPNDSEWIEGQSYNDLVRLQHDVLMPLAVELERMIAIVKQDEDASS